MFFFFSITLQETGDDRFYHGGGAAQSRARQSAHAAARNPLLGATHATGPAGWERPSTFFASHTAVGEKCGRTTGDANNNNNGKKMKKCAHLLSKGSGLRQGVGYEEGPLLMKPFGFTCAPPTW